jgi:hypothetical protein
MEGVIAEATRRSTDLLWVCRSNKGMRPRTAITLWQSLVRPTLEYASEIWAGQTTAAQAQKAEMVQMKFLRGTLGLHSKGSGVADEVVRAETGCERLRDRWAKLKLGYWRRLFAAPQGRLLREVAEFRWEERRAGGSAHGTRGWMPSAERMLAAANMEADWHTPRTAAGSQRETWKDRVHKAVNAASDQDREARMQGLSSTTSYAKLKTWGINPAPYSFSPGENGKRGQHVPERYLDDRTDLKGTRLKMLCRMGCLPVMDRVGREARPKWPKETRTCLCCNRNQVEDVNHFILECPMFTTHRTTMLTDVSRTLRTLPERPIDFQTLDPSDRLRTLPGKRVGDPIAEDRIDRTVKRFLRKAWNARTEVTSAINQVMGTSYETPAKAA